MPALSEANVLRFEAKRRVPLEFPRVDPQDSGAIAARLPALVELFRRGPGFPYSDYTRGEKGAPFALVFAFFHDADRIRRMEESELHHDRPALAGVICEFESVPEVRSYLRQGGWSATRFKQFVGCLVGFVLAQRGWQPTERSGSIVGLSRWFRRVQRYEVTPNE